MEEDERLAVIIYYAPWCKSCQKLNRNYEHLATELADGIVARKKVHGKIRCARVEYTPTTKDLIMKQLQIVFIFIYADF